MSLESLLKGFGTIAGNAVMNKKNRQAAEGARRQSFDTINSLDWEPMYASDTTPQYQKTQSPVARSYLESFLAGNNPSMTFSGSPNAGFVKARQQAAQDSMFGTMDQRLAQSRALQATNPYQVTSPTRKVMGEQAQAATWRGANPRAGNVGLTAEDQAKLVELGVLEKGQDVPSGGLAVAPKEQYFSAIRGALNAGDVDALNNLLHPKLDRPHAVARNRQRRKAEDRTRKAVAKYASIDDEEG